MPCSRGANYHTGTSQLPQCPVLWATSCSAGTDAQRQSPCLSIKYIRKIHNAKTYLPPEKGLPQDRNILCVLSPAAISSTLISCRLVACCKEQQRSHPKGTSLRLGARRGQTSPQCFGHGQFTACLGCGPLTHVLHKHTSL